MDIIDDYRATAQLANAEVLADCRDDHIPAIRGNALGWWPGSVWSASVEFGPNDTWILTINEDDGNPGVAYFYADAMTACHDLVAVKNAIDTGAPVTLRGAATDAAIKAMLATA